MLVSIAGIPGYQVIFRTLVVIFVIAGLAGCGIFQTLKNPMAPKRSVNADKVIEQLEAKFGTDTAIINYYGVENGQNKENRNKFITGRLALINIHYIQFIRRSAASKAQLDTAMTMLQLGVDLAITVVGGAAVKAALGAASAGITGTRTAVDKNFFYEKTVAVLITAMNAERKKTIVPILRSMKLGIEDYPLAQALTDLENYYQAGTFIGGLQAVQKDAGKKEAKADAKIALLKSSVFVEDENSKRISAFIWKDGKRLLDNNKHATPIAENLKKLRSWMEKNGLKTLAIQKLLDNPMLAKAREKAIKDIPIPKAK